MNTTTSKIIRKTAEHLDLPPVPAKNRWPELQEIAMIVANQACDKINRFTPLQQLKQPCSYPQQCTLELLIAELQRRV